MTNNEIDVVKFANIPTPSFENEKNNYSTIYVSYGDNNIFPQELLNYSDKSVTHSSCLRLIRLAIAGQGFTTDNEKATEFLKNLDFETDNSTLLEKISSSMSIFDGFALEVIWNKKGDKLVEIHFIPFENLRADKPDRYGNVLFYFYNSNWENNSTSEKISRFDPLLSKDFPKQILYIAKTNPKSICYPVPNYNSAINFIANEYQLSKHYLSCSVNGFTPSALITFIGNPTPDERIKNKNMFDRNFSGTENAGKYILNYVDNIEEKPVIDTIQTNNVVDLYLNSSNESKNAIITAHGITSPALLSINDGNSSIFSNGEELKTAWNLFYKVTINSYQTLIEKSMNIILKYSGFPDSNYKIIPFSPLDSNDNETVTE